jgi:histidinol-phosphate/aromatic aminotransferase/cobyric acid decarboxylase-like protein
MTLRALQDPNLDRDVAYIREMLRNRYVALRRELDANGLEYYPFNSAFFALVRTKHDAEATRLRLLEHTDQYGVGVGVISVPSAQAIRLSYSTVAESDIPAMVAKIADNERRM